MNTINILQRINAMTRKTVQHHHPYIYRRERKGKTSTLFSTCYVKKSLDNIDKYRLLNKWIVENKWRAKGDTN